MSLLEKSFETQSDAVKQSFLESGIPLRNCEPVVSGYRAVCSGVGAHRGSSGTPNPNSLKFCISRDSERERIWLCDDNKSPGFRVMTLHVEKKKSDDEWIAILELNPDLDSYEQMKTSLITEGWDSIPPHRGRRNPTKRNN